MDEHSGYNQIFIAKENVDKTSFRYLGALGIYKWVVTPFGLKKCWSYLSKNHGLNIP